METTSSDPHTAEYTSSLSDAINNSFYAIQSLTAKCAKDKTSSTSAPSLASSIGEPGETSNELNTLMSALSTWLDSIHDHLESRFHNQISTCFPKKEITGYLVAPEGDVNIQALIGNSVTLLIDIPLSARVRFAVMDDQKDPSFGDLGNVRISWMAQWKEGSGWTWDPRYATHA